MTKRKEIAFDTGVLVERDRIIKLMQPHLNVCNFEAVHGHGCDVCAWVRHTIDEINRKSPAENCGCVMCTNFDQPCVTCLEAYMECELG